MILVALEKGTIQYTLVGIKVCVPGYPSEIMILVDFADCEIIIDGMHKSSHIALESDD